MLLGDVLSWSCVFNLGDAFGPGYSGLAYARLPSANQALRIPIASSDYASLQNILRMVPLRVLRIPRAILF